VGASFRSGKADVDAIAWKGGNRSQQRLTVYKGNEPVLEWIQILGSPRVFIGFDGDSDAQIMMPRSIGEYHLHAFWSLGKDEVDVLWMLVNRIEYRMNLFIRKVIMEQIAHRIDEDPAWVPIARDVIDTRIMEDR
jgi:hypothetical protein